ncbi:MAG TPA: hypothetical protein DHW61_05520 [Lachnoclostridium phytofermentans]|uniref:Uncharacterized protein n=2 Tax=Lachnoclostridium TaxID=1506553 RepID=A0A3D2X5M0_9FIRM|nr:hypothetical protein [Lachnoclostridium phytofermentans]
MNGDLGVKSYEYGDGYIRVMFSTGAIYLYTNESAGLANIQLMKELTDGGEGLNETNKLNSNFDLGISLADLLW